jgi:hypothetical protein
MTTPHRIDALSIDLLFDRPGMPAAQPDATRLLVLERLLPLVEQVFDQIGGGDAVWRIDRLDIDLGEVSEAQLPQALAARLREALEALLGERPATEIHVPDMTTVEARPGGVRRIAGRRADLDLLLGFLAEGVLGWQLDAAATDTHEVLLMRVLAQDASALRVALRDAGTRAVMLTRLARQFGHAALQTILLRFMGEQAAAVLAQLGALQRWLQQQGVTRAHAAGAMQQAWAVALDAALISGTDVLSAHGQAPWRHAIVLGAVQWLARESGRGVPAMAGALLAGPSGVPGDGAAAAVQEGARHGADDSAGATPPDVATASVAALLHVLAQQPESRAAADAVVSGDRQAMQHRQAALDGRHDDDDSGGRMTSTTSAASAVTGSDVGSTPSAMAAPDGAVAERAGQPASLNAETTPARAEGVDVAARHALQAGLRHRIGAALMQGQAGALYAQWAGLLDTHAEVLRSALLHYGAYPDVRARIAAAFPLSLLSDMLVLCAPGVGQLTQQAWDESGLQHYLEQAAPGLAHGWRRHWWRTAFAYVVAQAQARGSVGPEAFDPAPPVVLAASDRTALLQTVLEEMGLDSTDPALLRAIGMPAVAQAPAVAHDDAVAQGLTASVAVKPDTMRAQSTSTRLPIAAPDAPAGHAAAAAPTHMAEPVDVPPVAAVFARIQAGAAPLHDSAVTLAHLLDWVGQAVSEPSFLQSIHQHARAARTPMDYYRRVLTALARQQVVDLEWCAQDDPAASTAREDEHPARAEERPDLRQEEARAPDALTPTHAPRQDASPSHAMPASVQRHDEAPHAASVALAVDLDPASQHMRSRLAARLTQALLRADPAFLAGDWGRLLQQHPDLLSGALLNYGAHTPLLSAIVAGFPDSLLRDMALVLWPGMEAAWQVLYGAVDDALARDAQLSIGSLLQWRKQVWQTVLQQGIAHGRAAAGLSPVDASGDITRQPSVADAVSDVVASDAATSAPATGTAWVAAVDAMLADPTLRQQDWQRRLLLRWRDMGPAIGMGEIAASASAASVQGTSHVVHDDAMATAIAHTVGETVEVASATVSGQAVFDALAAIFAHPLVAELEGTSGAALDTALDLIGMTSAIVGAGVSSAIVSAMAPPLPPSSENGEGGEPPGNWPASARTALRRQFERLATAESGAWAQLTTQQAWQLIAAHVLAHADDAALAAQRQRFLHAILAHAPAGDAAARQRYLVAVLSGLIEQQPLDLEDLAALPEKNAASMEVAPVSAPAPPLDAVSEPLLASAVAAQPHAPAKTGATAQPPSAATPSSNAAPTAPSQDFIAWLRAAAFADQVTAPAGFMEWFTPALAAGTPELAPALALAMRSPGAVARLLTWLPHRLLEAVVVLAPQTPAQRQRLLRHADDIAELFGQDARDVSAAALRQARWRFLLPWLFDPARVFDPGRLAEDMVAFLARDTGAAPSAALWSRLREQLGIVRPSDPDAGAATARQRAPAAAPSSRAATAATTEEGAVPALSGIHVANAGMVLAWPFLTRAWEALGLTREQRFVDEQAAQRAAWLLQFLVFERLAVPEYQLTLNKLLCGIPLQAPIVASIDVTEEEAALIGQLLGAMIAHWKSLGNTTIDGLRQTFLQRQGYLAMKEDGWHLHVPKATFDMLLDKLPWSISTVRLPWMETILWVDWI